MAIRILTPQEIKVQAKWQDDIKRREESAKAIDFYNDWQVEHTKDHLKPRYPNTFKEIENDIIVEYVTSDLIDKLSMMFHEPPEYQFDGMDKTRTEAMLDIIKKIHLHDTLDNIQKQCNNYLKVGVMPLYDLKRKETYLQVLTPDMYFVDQDPDRPTKAEAVFYNVGVYQNSTQFMDRVDLYLMVTDKYTQLYEIDSGTGKRTQREEPQGHKYGKLPVVFFDLFPSAHNFFPDRENKIVKTNLDINHIATSLGLMIDYQAISTLVEIGVDRSEQPATERFGVKHKIVIPAARMGEAGQLGDVKYITPDAKIDSVYNILEGKLVRLAMSLGLSASAMRIDSEAASSGYALMLRRSDLISRNVKQQSYFEQPIVELLRLIMMTETLYGKIGLGTPEAIDRYDIGVVFGSVDYKEEPTTEADIRQKNITMGTKSPVDYIMEDNPNLTEEEALAKYEENIRLRQGRKREPDQIDRMIEEL